MRTPATTKGGGLNYAEKLRDPRWQRRRLEIMSRASFTCESCEATDKTLNVHHKLYRKGTDPWEYADHELACVCEDCHEAYHAWRKRLDETLAQLDSGQLQMVVGYAQGLLLNCLVDHDRYSDAQVPAISAEQIMGIADAWSLRFIEVDGAVVGVSPRLIRWSALSLLRKRKAPAPQAFIYSAASVSKER